MRQRIVGISLIATVLAVGANLATTAILEPAELARAGWSVGLLAYLLGIVLLFAALFRRSARNAALFPLLAGWFMLSASACIVLFPRAEALAADWIGATSLTPNDLSLILQACGALGLALGFGLWTAGVVQGADRGKQRSGVLENEVVELRKKNHILAEQLDEVMSTDSLTGALNRRAFIARFDEVLQRDMRLGRSFAFLLIDIVGLREINSRSRLDGDAALERLVRCLKNATRGTDFVGRLGDDEFGVLLGECDEPQPVVSRVFMALDDRPTADDDHQDDTPTEPSVRARLGVVSVKNAAWCTGFAQLFELAEDALRSIAGSSTNACATRELQPTRLDDFAAAYDPTS